MKYRLTENLIIKNLISNDKSLYYSYYFISKREILFKKKKNKIELINDYWICKSTICNIKQKEQKELKKNCNKNSNKRNY